jgi:hypothetical protein
LLDIYSTRRAFSCYSAAAGNLSDRPKLVCLYIVLFSRCSNKHKSQCEARAKIIGEDATTATLSNIHNHPAPDVNTLQLKNRIKRAAEESVDTLKFVFDEVTRHDPSAGKVTFKSLESAMQKRKRLNLPALPATPAEFPALLVQSNMSENYRSDIHVGNVFVGSVFYSVELIDYIVNLADCGFDGTFDTVPRTFFQLFTIFGCFERHSIPLIFCLMTTKTEAAYLALFEKLTDLLPQFNPATAMGDFEPASRNAIQEVFPEIEMRSCFFHFSQAVFRKIITLGLTTAFKDNHGFNRWAKAVMSLPLLPSENMFPTWNVLEQQFIDLEVVDQLKLTQFKEYFRNQWINGFHPTELAVQDYESATNNGAESFHSKLKFLIKVSHPNIWRFMQVLNNVIKDSRNDIDRLNNGLDISRPRKKQTVRILQRRNLCRQRLANGMYTPLQFLFSVSHTVFIPRRLRVPRARLEAEEENLLEFEEENPLGDEEELGDEEYHNYDYLDNPLDIIPDVAADGDNYRPFNDLTECSICYEVRPDTYAFVPCGHIACGSCTLIIERGNNRRCHYCNLPFERRFRVHLG